MLVVDKLKVKSDFTKNVLTLLTGTTIAQAIPIAISPILTRLYTPADFGVVALFMAIVASFGSISNGRYELAIMLPQREEDAINLFALSLIISTLISLILFFTVLLFGDKIATLLGDSEIKFWLYFVPITVFFVGLYNSLDKYNTRYKNYKDIAKSKVIKSSVLAAIQLSVGFIKQGATGLVTGQILAQMFANLKLLKNIISNKELLSKISFNSIKNQAKRFVNFPKYSLSGVVASSMSVHFIEILISTFFSIATLGFYSLVQRVLGLPSSFIGGSIGQVFYQEATQEKHKSGRAIKVYKSTFKKLLVLGVIFFGFLYFSVEEIFTFVFGKDWKVAGVYAQILIPLFFVRFIYVSLSMTYDVFESLKTELVWQVSYFLGLMALIYICKDGTFEHFLYLFTVYGSLMYLISLYITYRLAKGVV